MTRVGPRLRYALALTAIAAAYSLLLLRLQNHWWLEDDPYLMAQAALQPEPWAFFVSRDALSRGLVGFLFTPLQSLSFWVDMQVAPRSPGFAYAHTALALWLAMLMLFVVLREWLTDRTAFVATTLVLLLPATIVLAEFVSVRNYIEGLVLSLTSVRLAQVALRSRGLTAMAAVGGAAVFYLLGALAKELYATTPLVLLVTLCAWRRRWGAAAVLACAGAFYVAYYRAVAGGIDLTFNVPPLTAAEYPTFLGRYPYIFSGSWLGWGLVLGTLAAVAAGVRSKAIPLRELGFAALLLVVAFASIHPASASLSAEYASHGAWYRVSFVTSLLALVLSVWLLRRLAPRWRIGLAVAAFVTLAAGAWTTVRVWDGISAQYHVDGRFYLSNPDKLLYSDVPAWWFLVGLDQLYAVPERHYVSAHRRLDGDAALLGKFGAVWRYSPVIGGHFPAPDVFRRLTSDRAR